MYLFGGGSVFVVDDPNLFFGVLSATLCSILLSTNLCRASLVTTDWFLLASSSAALLTSSIGAIRSYEEEFGEIIGNESMSSLASRLSFSLYLSISSLVVSLIMVFLYKVIKPKIHLLVSSPFFILWLFGVPYVTPHVTLSSTTESASAAIYFTVWGGLVFSLDILTLSIALMHQNMEETKEKENKIENDNTNDNKTPNEETSETSGNGEAKLKFQSDDDGSMYYDAI
jgi:hypothetical protein